VQFESIATNSETMRPIEGEYPCVYLNGIVLKRSVAPKRG
jgi:hypothetical protein